MSTAMSRDDLNHSAGNGGSDTPQPGAAATGDQEIDVAGTEADPHAAAAHRGTAAQHTCEVCGNVYEKSFRIEVDGTTHVFDSFECAIHRLAPTCAHCGCRIIGHGVEAGGQFYCCDNCVRMVGAEMPMHHA